MVLRRVDLRFLLFLGLAVSGCECGEKLLDVSARLTVEPQSLDFGDVVRGDFRLTKVQLGNAGSVALKLTESELQPAGGEFSFVSAIPDSLAPQQTLDLNLSYEPRDLGEDLATITFASDDGFDPITVSLRGRGVESGVGVELEGDPCTPGERSLAFGNVSPGDTAERDIHIQSQGSSPLTVLSATVENTSSGEWTIDASALPVTLTPGQEVVLVARYSPADGGADQGAFVITTDSPSDPTIRILACGTGVAPAICATPVPLDLGGVADGQSATGRLRLESCGLEPLELTSIALASDAQHPTHAGYRLTQVPATPATLQPGEAVEVEVTFDARLPFGPAEGWVQTQSNALPSGANYFPLLASVATPCSLYVAPTIINFRDVAVAQTVTNAVLIGNSGEIECTIASLSVTTLVGAMEFGLSSPPATPFTIASGDARTIDVSYTPMDMMTHEGELVIEDAGGARFRIPLFGNPPEVSGCWIEPQPTVLSFGVAAIGTLNHLSLRAMNVGDEPCRITGASLVNGDPAFVVDAPLIGLALPGLGVTIDVTYAPTASVPSADQIRIDSVPLGGAMGGGTAYAGVVGNAADARICVMPPMLDFGIVAAGTVSTRTIDISNCGAVDLNLRGVLLTGSAASPFSMSAVPALPQNMASGASAAPVLQITYAPANAGPHFGQIEVLSSDRQTPTVQVPLSGNWDGSCTRVLDCAPLDVAFGDTIVGTDKLIRVVCRNLSSATVDVGSVALSGNGPELTIDADTPVTINPGDAWSFDVFYAPVMAAASSATLSIQSNACIAPAAIPVSGDGVVEVLPPCLPPSTFQPTVEWRWNSTTYEPTYVNVWSTPLVANLNDDNGDSRIDENDMPEVIFISFDTYSFTDPAASIPGVLRVLNGDTGAEEFSVEQPRFADSSLLAVGDIDGDGAPEIIGSKWVMTPPGTGAGGFFGRYITGSLVALDNTGRLKWESDPWSWPAEVSWNSAAPSIADLDGDGFAEIILGREVFDHRGHLLWRGNSGAGLTPGGPHSIVADIDLDGRPEVIAGGTVYRNDGAVAWEVPNSAYAGTAVGMLDVLDPFPQIAIDLGATMVVVDHLGIEQWRVGIPTAGAATMLPTIADFDGDGDGDLAIADGEAVYVYNGTGGLIWSSIVMDSTCCVGISAFDFEGDGAFELILTDYGTVYVYRGSDGTQIYSAARPSVTAYEMPVVADIDNDGKGELLVALLGNGGNNSGIVAYSNIGDTWVGAPRIWNQQAFHVRNIYESGAVPRVPTPLDQGPNVFRGTVPRCE